MKKLFLPYANNKGAFVVRCLDSIIHLLAKSEIWRLLSASVARQAGLSLTWSQTPKTGFLVTRFKLEKEKKTETTKCGHTSRRPTTRRAPYFPSEVITVLDRTKLTRILQTKSFTNKQQDKTYFSIDRLAVVNLWYDIFGKHQLSKIYSCRMSVSFYLSFSIAMHKILLHKRKSPNMEININGTYKRFTTACLKRQIQVEGIGKLAFVSILK